MGVCLGRTVGVRRLPDTFVGDVAGVESNISCNRAWTVASMSGDLPGVAVGNA